MGLDITAYDYAERMVPQPEPDEDGEYPDDLYDTAVHVYALAAFEHALRGLDHVVPRRYGTDILDAGWYVVGDGKLQFRAGSYGGYGQFRDNLSIAALGVGPQEVWTNPDEYQDRPFFELIHFADNEGTLGPQACAALAADFAEQRETVIPKWDPADETQAWYRRKYDDWQQAFELAAGTGLVVFS